MPALSELDSVLMQNIELSITSLLALNYEGKAVLNVYPNYLAVSFVEGKIVLNPNYPDNTNYSIASMDVGIGKETSGNEWGGVSVKGVKLALFDVSDVKNPKIVGKIFGR